MSPAWIRKRRVSVKRNPRGVSYQVLWRFGGAGSGKGGEQAKSAGTFTTETLAKTRRDLVAGWLAQGKDPRVELAKLRDDSTPVRGYDAWAAAYISSRIDYDDKTSKAARSHLAKLSPLFGRRDPFTLTVADNIEAVAELSRALAASSVAAYWGTHKQILDFAGVKPNPARDDAVKLPRIPRTEIVPPSGEHFLKMLDKTIRRWRLPLVVLEQTGMAVGEAASLEWGDVDVDGNRFRLQRENVKAQLRARARWVQVPEWLMEIIAETCVPEDRASHRRVFPGFTPTNALRTMTSACKTAGVPHFTPHQLRHRRTSLWHGQGVPTKELSARVGHSDAFMTLNRYSHVMPLDEVPVKALQRLLR